MASRKGRAPKRPTKAERELARKRSEAAARGWETRQRNERKRLRAERAAERERERLAAERAAKRAERAAARERERIAAERDAARKRKPTATSSPPRAKAKPTRATKAKPKKPKKRTPPHRAESARKGWDTRREREAIRAALPPAGIAPIVEDSARAKGLTDIRIESGMLTATSPDGGDFRAYSITKTSTGETRVYWVSAGTLAGYASPQDFGDAYEIDSADYEISFFDESEAA